MFILITWLPASWTTWWLHAGPPDPIDPGHARISLLAEGRVRLALEEFGLPIQGGAPPVLGGIDAMALWVAHLRCQLAARLIGINALPKHTRGQAEGRGEGQ